MSSIRKLPVGIQDFEDLRTNGYVYVDKTAYVYSLATTGKPYFLSRPRRFGKSLFLSTLKAYFQGKKELFKGLAIVELEKEWVEYPVFYIDFNVGIISDEASLRDRLDAILTGLENQWGREVENNDPATRLEAVIKSAYKQTGKKVVVLVDEYDKPLINVMDDLETSETIRKVLKGFYGVLKSMDAYLRFVFLTGVTKFSRVSIFGDLNQLQDISMDSRFSGICGITETELIREFKPELQALAKKTGTTYEKTLAELKKQYDGYHFVKESEDIYNPFSLLNTFAKLDFGEYWYETGTPTFLIKKLKSMDYDIKKLDGNVKMPGRSIYKTDSNTPISLLYQTGYLTIKGYEQLFDEYTLGFPNEEVKYGFLNELAPFYLSYREIESGDFSAVNFVKELMSNNVEGFMKRLQAFFADIPNELNNKEEKHYQTVFYLLFKLMGQFIQTEVSSATGRADAVAEVDNTIYIFEFKLTDRRDSVHTVSTAEEALKQIDERKYAARYAVSNKKIVKIGAEFNAEERTLSRWAIA